MPRKISQYDRFQTLRRNPVYQEDYRKFKKWCRERGIDPKDYHDHPEAAQKAEELCQKYNIWYLFDYLTKIPQHLGGDYFIKDNNVVEVIYPKKYRGLSEEEISHCGIPKYLPIPEFE